MLPNISVPAVKLYIDQMYMYIFFGLSIEFHDVWTALYRIQIYEAGNNKKLPYVFSSKEERTTETEDKAIAADAIQGLREMPTGTKMPKKRTHKMQCTCIF